MAFDSLHDRLGGHESVTPLSIARNDLFTAKEKIELLTQLKADVTVAQQEGLSPSIAPEDIDLALAEIRQDVEDGNGSETHFQGES